VFVNWGAINWLPDIRRWAEIVAHFINPGGELYLAEGHRSAHVFDDEKRLPDGMPGYYIPYFVGQSLRFDDPRDYADDSARLENATTYEWLHPLGKIVTSLLDAGLTLKWLHEHDSVPWRMFDQLVEDANGMYCWPDKPWFPLAFSLRAQRPIARGTGPVLSSLIAVLFLGEQPGVLGILGIASIGVGIFFLAGGIPGTMHPRSRVAVVAGFLTDGSIASYTVWDKYAAPQLEADYLPSNTCAAEWLLLLSSFWESSQSLMAETEREGLLVASEV
jgi:hypothetical protein